VALHKCKPHTSKTTDALWEKQGSALLEASRQSAALLGAVQFVVVCGQKDEAKRKFLSDANLTVASEWYTGSV